MPVPSFLASFADKAQTAINASPLASHLPASLQQRPSSPDAATQPSANEAAAQGGAKSHALETLQYQFRSLQQQYSTTSPIQKIVTTEKGVVIDFENVSRNSKAQSKELYTWGQSEQHDLKDGKSNNIELTSIFQQSRTDLRTNFVQGSLASSLSTRLNSARGPFKALRDAETNLQPRRNIRSGIQNQIARVENESQKGGDKRIADLREQLLKAESEDQQLEREVELLKRKAVRDSEQMKWDAIREYGEKLVLLSQAASPIIAVLPSVPPTTTTPYTGAQTTGAVRASLQRALDNYKTGHINLPPQVSASDLSRSDTRSFGESHASELSSIHSDAPTHSAAPSTPSPVSKPLPEAYPTNASGSTPINPHSLNNLPAPIPNVPAVAAPTPDQPTPVPNATVAPVSPPTAIHGSTPTIAETGVPIVTSNPGPASGSLHNIQAAADSAEPRSGGLPAADLAQPSYGQPAAVAKHETAEEEKKRLAAAYSQQPSSPQAPLGAPTFPVPAASSAQPVQHHETAEEEKKRLEREERERILHSGGGPNFPPKDNKDKEEDLPAYQEPGQ